MTRRRVLLALSLVALAGIASWWLARTNHRAGSGASSAEQPGTRADAVPVRDTRAARPPGAASGVSPSRNAQVAPPGTPPSVDPTSPAYAPTEALLRQPRDGMATELFDAESRNQAWAEVAEPVILESVLADTKGLEATIEVECRQLGCRVRADGPLAKLEQTMLQVQLVPCAVGGVEGMSEDGGRFHLDYYCFYEPGQIDVASFAEWYRDRHVRISRNLQAAGGGGQPPE